jgi:hypothetical protein
MKSRRRQQEPACAAAVRHGRLLVARGLELTAAVLCYVRLLVLPAAEAAEDVDAALAERFKNL